MGRYGKSCEQRFRQNFSKDFDWLEFNLSLSDRVLTGDRKAIAIDNGDLYTLIAYSKSLKQMVRLAVCYSSEGKMSKLFFSTDPNMSGKDVIEHYRTRFQIEFCIRDAKGFTGLIQSQARDGVKLSFNLFACLALNRIED